MNPLIRELIEYAIEHKEEGAILGTPLLFIAKYYKQIKKKLLKSDLPTLKQFIKIFADVYEHMSIIIVDVSNTYDIDLDDFILNLRKIISDEIERVKSSSMPLKEKEVEIEKIKQKDYTEEQIAASKKTYRAIMWASFFPALIQFFYFFATTTDWPKKNSEEYNILIRDKHNFLYKLIWNEFDSYYSRLFIITIEGRRKRMEQGYDDMEDIFRKVVKYWYNIRGL